MDEYNGCCTTYILKSAVVFKEDYQKIVDKIKVHVDKVVNGYSYKANSFKSDFTEDAKNNRLIISQIIDDYYFGEYGEEGGLAEGLYGDKVSIQSVTDLQLMEIVVEGVLLLNHTFTNFQLQQLVARKYIKDDLILVNPGDLFVYFCNLRDQCLLNWKANFSLAVVKIFEDADNCID